MQKHKKEKKIHIGPYAAPVLRLGILQPDISLHCETMDTGG